MPSLQYQRDRGRDLLECRSCGETFPEGKATNDGWHYECPECNEATGLGQGLRRV